HGDENTFSYTDYGYWTLIDLRGEIPFTRMGLSAPWGGAGRGFHYNNEMLPAGTGVENMSLIEEGDSSNELSLTESGTWGLGLTQNLTLNRTPGSFRLIYDHQQDFYLSESPCFFQDEESAYFVTPRDVWGQLPGKESQVAGKPSSEAEMSGFLASRFPGLHLFDTAPKNLDSGDILEASRAVYRHHRRVSTTTASTEVDVLSSSRYRFAESVNSLSSIEVSRLSSSAPAIGAEVKDLHAFKEKRYLFEKFYHPYAGDFIKIIQKDGIEGFLSRDIQMREDPDAFESRYLEDGEPNAVKTPYPKKDIDFSYEGSYSLYNWELFFHIPMLMATRLTQNQKFEAAQKWFHYIFDPTDRSNYGDPQRFWQMKRFFELAESGDSEVSIRDAMLVLNYTGTESTLRQKKDSLEAQIGEWRERPFEPHTVASLRPIVYMKAIVMHYLDHLLAWGDYLFRQDTIETINEATQLYVIASQILGERPEMVDIGPSEDKTYNDLKDNLDSFSNALIQLENETASSTVVGSVPSTEELGLSINLYFCIPHNEKLVGYWDHVDDRLSKIRHCMNIEGVKRSLALFQPPIDPGMLVKARASGVDLGSALAEISAAVPHYQFQPLLQKAVAFCTDVQILGSSLMQALEKKDSEAMALLQSDNQDALLNAMSDVRELQIDQAKASLLALKKSESLIGAKSQYYQDIEKITAHEQAQLENMANAEIFQGLSSSTDILGGVLQLLPETTIGLGAGVTFGGRNLGGGSAAAGSYFRMLGSIENNRGVKKALKGQQERRWDDWKLQEEALGIELERVAKQIEAAQKAVAIVEKERDNHERQIVDQTAIKEMLTRKFTNHELYGWLVSQVSTLFFQSYQMAYDLAKRAEKAYQYQLGTDKSFIQFGYWDSLKKGLLSGEKLNVDLRRLEMSFFEQNRRLYEINKNVSLATIDPTALYQLKTKGSCIVKLPEALFDLDYPGHYMRRLKSVSLTLPGVTGSYTNINCRLTMVSSKWRRETSGTTYSEIDSDSRFVYRQSSAESIVTSSAQEDGGLFKESAGDGRFLPFEGAGAISEWQLEFPSAYANFDYQTLSDVIMHVKYTAKEGGETLKEAVTLDMEAAIESMALGSESGGLNRVVSLRSDFA
ncbi:MAG: hypothetical protein ACI9BD_001495, partial [Candidatus Marinamargulisbacteria bacterium]